MDSANLIRMINQIARNFAIQGDDAAATQTAQHVRDFWDPRMIAEIIAADQRELSSISRDAVLAIVRGRDQ